jgi:hypothetical protein
MIFVLDAPPRRVVESHHSAVTLAAFAAGWAVSRFLFASRRCNGCLAGNVVPAQAGA